MTEAPAAAACPACGATHDPADAFCEACGSPIGGAVDPPADPPTRSPADPADATADPTGPMPRPTGEAAACRACGGALEDGYCTECGVKAPSPRDHWSEEPAPWLAGVCDRGIAHPRNEDAMALAATADASRGVMVVCDGVTTAPDSDRAALAASRAACQVLAAAPAVEGSGEAAAIRHWDGVLRQAAQAANAEAVGAAHILGDPPEPPSCTFVAAVVTPGLVHVGWCGDSRAYWLPDEGEGEQLTVDHSLGTEMVRSGMSQADAEVDPRFHTITRWLGADSVDATPEIAARRLDTSGYVAVVSDGLWNYASSPAALRAAMDRAAEHVGSTASPATLAAHLVEFANAQGGHDNITAALARVSPH